MAETSATDIAIRLSRVIDWLTEHPELPVARVDYAGNDGIELTLEAGGYELLAAAVKAAESIGQPEITVTVAEPPSYRIIDSPRQQWCQLLISGSIPVDAEKPPGGAIRVLIAAICYDHAAVALRNSLGTPPIPGEFMWYTTGEHLRSLLPVGA